MSETLRYSVGWYHLTPAQLEKIPEEYREECQSIRLFNGIKPTFYETIGEALGMLHQIIKVNHADNLKHLTGVGAEGLFVVELTTTDTDDPAQKRATSLRKIDVPPYIIPIPPPGA